MLLTIDRGNTTLDVMLHGEPAQRWRAPASEPGAVLAAVAALAAPSRAVGSTVVGGGLDAVAGVLQDRFGVRLEVAGRDLACPLAVAYADPTTLGTDRWLAALAAFTSFGPAVVVQCGTALTVDAVDAGGRFLGGGIGPGLLAMARGLAAAAPRLPAFDAARSGPLPATSSEDCVAAGVMAGFCGAVERLLDDVGQVLPHDAARVITGGDAEVYLQHGRRRLTHVSDLLHQGLRCLATTYGPPC